MTEETRALLPQEATQNPFLTAALIEQRWRQRQVMRCVPELAVGRVRPVVVVGSFKDPVLNQLAESEIRNCMDAVGEPIKDFFDLAQRALRAEVFSEALYVVDRADSALGELSEQTAATASEQRIDSVEKEIVSILMRWLLLAFMADDLAEDKYQDSRRPMPK